jgi:hypothetical protein
MTELPAAITPSVVAACLVLIAAVSAALHRGTRMSGASPRDAARLAGAAAAAAAVLLAATAAVAATGLYGAQADETVPWIGVGLAVPLLLGLLALRRPAVAHALSGPRMPALLAAVQVFRVAGAVFLVVAARGQLPAAFALPAGIGDVLIGLAAPLVALALWRRPQRRGLGIVFNALGLLDLVVAVGIGVALAPGPLQLVAAEPSTAALGVLPLVLVPTFAVPLAVVLHVASFRLLAAPRPAGVVRSTA